jgi:formylglycine-generating enzyme required for sulfatase activity
MTGENPPRFHGTSDALPVNWISWRDAIAFCNKLRQREGLKPVYQPGGVVQGPNGQGYGFPTEAEWEYACRAGSTTRYSFNDDAVNLDEFACFPGNSGGKTHPVGRKRPNAWGLYDMHGNLWERCGDWYDPDYYRRSPTANLPGPSHRDARVFRGRCWLEFSPLSSLPVGVPEWTKAGNVGELSWIPRGPSPDRPVNRDAGEERNYKLTFQLIGTIPV